jgi:hypothetical protein|tara:strand:+ start:2851 stop:5940 length:3090 start_codon:yes stop_codon:yes gene_type:complete
METFKKLNNIIGWLVFSIASFVYLSTIEPTVSFWDCGEYIATAYKLEVGHPPGAPLFQLLGRIFSLFAEPATSQVAVAINILSALCSSFTILFLFWTITSFSKRIFSNKKEDSLRIYAILLSGVIGSLAYTFSDSFWFSAVEGEVYAMSSFFTAITFWCILKWEEASEEYATRWLILIAYLIGLSIGVHLLSLLTIPAMGMIYYNKKYTYSKFGAIKAFVLSMAILGIVQGVIIPGVVSLISKFEIFFVNTVGLPFNAGAIIYFTALIALISYGLYYSNKNKKPILNTIILSFMMLLIGYSSFAVLVVRSNANPPIDENNPEDAVGLLSYLKREQYGSWPIVYGQYFNAKLDSKKPYIDGNPVYAKDEKKGKYIVIDTRKNSLPNYRSQDKTFFPRMWSNTQSRHAAGYKSWAGLSKKDRTPTFSQNLSFFFKYQIGWSYLRYFMWNFAGRQNDYMNMDGNSLNGNWESGIGFIDNARLGTPSNVDMPDHLKNNKAKNHYYFLPLILGLIGLFFHFKHHNQDALAVLLFFLFTGVLIIIYLNVVPFQPRERDYAYVGSFYAFSIWIGLGMLGIYDFLKKNINPRLSLISATIISLLMAPALMASENWNDHDRSDRYTALEVAKNYLNSCAKNAILFTNGDNDTFPLWYAQEVEGIRTDIKVVNLSLFNTPWYIDQMKRKSYDAEAIPSSLENEDYRAGTRDYTPIQEKFKEFKEVSQVVRFINSKSSKAKVNTSAGLKNYCPTRKLKLTVDKEKAKKFVPDNLHSNIVDEMRWSLKGNGLYKNKLMVLDILANFNWDRPIYFAITVGKDNFMGLEKYFQLEGLAYRLVPYLTKNNDGQTGAVASEIMYDNLINKFAWGGLNNKEIYFDETNTRMIMNYRNNYARLAEKLIEERKNDQAIIVLNKCVEEFPREVVNLSYFAIPIIDLYYRLDQKTEANRLLSLMIDDYLTEYNYLAEFKSGSGLKQNLNICGQVLGSLSRVVQVHQLTDSKFDYFEDNDKYFKTKDQVNEEIDYETFRINTFLEDFYALQ